MPLSLPNRRILPNRPHQPRISIVIPARNEARNLEIVLPDLPAVHEVILVDGHSVDGTIEAAQAVLPDIKVVRQTRTGKGNALACGFAAATGDVIVMFDADGSADPAEIPLFLEALSGGADFAKGSRFLTGGGSADITRVRSAGNLGLNVLANRMTQSRYSDLCYGYNAFWRDILGLLDLPSTQPHSGGSTTMVWGDGFEIETVINCRIAFARLTVTEVPSVERCRIYGQSNLNAVSDGLRVLKTIMTERRRAAVSRNRFKAADELMVADVGLGDGEPAHADCAAADLDAAGLTDVDLGTVDLGTVDLGTGDSGTGDFSTVDLSTGDSGTGDLSAGDLSTVDLSTVEMRIAQRGTVNPDNAGPRARHRADDLAESA